MLSSIPAYEDRLRKVVTTTIRCFTSHRCNYNVNNQQQLHSRNDSQSSQSSPLSGSAHHIRNQSHKSPSNNEKYPNTLPQLIYYSHTRLKHLSPASRSPKSTPFHTTTNLRPLFLKIFPRTFTHCTRSYKFHQKKVTPIGRFPKQPKSSKFPWRSKKNQHEVFFTQDFFFNKNSINNFYA